MSLCCRFDKLFGGDVGDATTVTAGLVRPGDRCNSLPDIDNANDTAGDELRHWLRKLDKLSSELQDFNSRPPPASGTPSSAWPVIFTARRYASAVFAVVACLPVGLSVWRVM